MTGKKDYCIECWAFLIMALGVSLAMFMIAKIESSHKEDAQKCRDSGGVPRLIEGHTLCFSPGVLKEVK